LAWFDDIFCPDYQVPSFAKIALDQKQQGFGTGMTVSLDER